MSARPVCNPPRRGWIPRKLDLGYCDVKAPITGLIGAKQVSIGDLVGKGEPTLLATISTLDPIWFYCNVSEVDYIQAHGEEPASSARISTSCRSR